MENIVEKLKETFREESYELLSELETALLELEKTPDDRRLIDRIFRAMHTIKGSGAMCEFKDVAEFAHDLETALDLVRKGGLIATKELINRTLSALDQIKAMLDRYYCNGTVDEEKTRQVLASIRELLPVIEAKKASAPGSARGRSTPVKDGRNPFVTYRIRFQPAPDIFAHGINPVFLINELRGLGPCKVIAQTDEIPFLEDLDPEACYTYWDVVLTTDQGINAIKDVFIFIKDECELKIDVIHEEGGLDDEASYKKLGDILLDRGDLAPEDLSNILKGQRRVGEMLVESGLVSGDKVQSALLEQQAIRALREKHREADTVSSIRVPTDRLDTLVNLVGELVTVQARLSQTALSLGSPDFISLAEEVERLTADLRDNTLNIRMLPIGTTFSKFKRLVRSLSQELHKEIELTTDGADTELDKTMIERLWDPLVHLMRNSIDHGIELPQVREASGKPKQGTIHLSARHSGNHVLITIQDDGAGLDPEVIRGEAIQKGLISANADLAEQDLFSLIFLPGFSTVKEVTSVSGRGVGMDVVKKAIDALNGSIEISSVRGKGTIITLTLPLTLAIIDGFLTKIGAENFIFPLAEVEECIELTQKDIENSHGRHMTNVRGRLVPYVRLREQFMITGAKPAIEQIVIARSDNQRVGFVVDTIIGEHQTVIKSLGRFYRQVEGVSGATILGDGTVALILDVRKLTKTAEQEETAIQG